MNKNIVIYFFSFFLLILQIHAGIASEDEDADVPSLSGKSALTTIPTERSALIGDHTSHPVLRITNPIILEDNPDDSSKSPIARRIDLLDREDLDVSEEEEPVFTRVQQIFEQEDPLQHRGMRWGARLVGAMAEQAIIPMILYFTLGLLNVNSSSVVDYCIIAFSMAYLFLPTVENMATVGQDFADWIFNKPKQQAVPSYEPPQHLTSQPFLTLASHLHAGGMALILTTVFNEIEATQFNWFFWTFFVPYGLTIYCKNIYFFKQGQQKKVKWLRHNSESSGEKHTRKILNKSLRKFLTELSTLKSEELKELYTFLTDDKESPQRKMRLFFNTEQLIVGISVNTGTDIDPRHEILSRHVRGAFLNSPSLLKGLLHETSSLLFYGSLIPEYFLYQYGLSLVCRNFGMSSVLAQQLTSHLCAGLLSTITLFFERQGIEQYYHTVFKKFGRSYSMSNPNLRGGNAVLSFIIGGVLALSEVYPAWKAVFSTSIIQYPFLGFMMARHHARNAFWLQQGFDRGLSHFHRRDCWRDKYKCCTSCKRGSSEEQMKDAISGYTLNLLNLIDYLSPKDVEALYKIHFGHNPVHE